MDLGSDFGGRRWTILTGLIETVIRLSGKVMFEELIELDAFTSLEDAFKAKIQALIV